MSTVEEVEPLRWLLHGKPGTGKSHAIKKLQTFFEDVAGYQKDVDFKIDALQATMATKIDGDTIHHALHIRRGEAASSADPSAAPAEGKLSKEMLLWRWLIIDEISMVSAHLLAEMDVKLRDVVRDLDMQKRGLRNVTRPFGGFNVL